jgi:epoxyqueuosine reductase
MSSVIDYLLRLSTELEISGIEHISLANAASGQAYLNWLQKDYHGKMAYMANNKETRLSPQMEFKDMRSLIVVTQDYFPHPAGQDKVFPNLRVAHYAQGKDYHFWFKHKLDQLVTELKKIYPDQSFMTFTDAVPLLERDLAAQAGLGWFGKNTCLIHPKKGSLFFIGEILCSLPAPKTLPQPLPDFCGSCTACLDACPTQAFIEPRVMDARRCISYWNIESKDVPPVELRSQMQDWFFGCDICQTVCPWNIKLHKLHPDFAPPKPKQDKLIADELSQILRSSNKQLLKLVKGTPMDRAGGRGLKRNALIVIGNLRLKACQPEVLPLVNDPRLGELAQWTLSQFSSSDPC